MMRIILASQSPRRKELLVAMGLQFEAVPSNFDEQLDSSKLPVMVAQELAIGKANLVADQYPDALVIGSDTIVSVDGQQLAKPHDADEARQMLQSMSGRGSVVTTSVTVIHRAKGILLSGAEETLVVFRPYDVQAVDAYLATGDYADKAGGYGIQSGAASLIDHIEGDYDTIVGLPTRLLANFLNQCGIAAHQVQPEVPVKQIALVE